MTVHGCCIVCLFHCLLVFFYTNIRVFFVFFLQIYGMYNSVLMLLLLLKLNSKCLNYMYTVLFLIYVSILWLQFDSAA